MMPYETYVNLIQQLDELVALFEEHRDTETREQVGALLSGLDMLHRAGLTRLVEMLGAAGAGHLVTRIAADDRVVRTLLGLYDLAELDLPPEHEVGSNATSPPPAFVPLDRLTYRRAAGE